MAQRIHPASEVEGRLAQTRLETAQLHARHRVDVQRRAAFRDARERSGSLLELVDQLGVSSQDPGEIVFLQERAREEAAIVVCLLGGKGAAVLQPRQTSLELEQAVELLNDVLRLAEDRLTGSARVALELALIVRAGIDGLVHAQRGEQR